MTTTTGRWAGSAAQLHEELRYLATGLATKWQTQQEFLEHWKRYLATYYKWAEAVECESQGRRAS